MEVKRHSKKIGIIILIAFILIIGGIVSYIVINYNNDKAEISKRMDAVKSSYEEFKNNVSIFNEQRDKIYEVVMQDMYYQTLKDNDLEYKEMYKQYEESLKKIDNTYKKVKGKCINVLHPDSSANNKCEAIVIGYEEVVNTYISDVNNYNKNIEDYNNWLTTNNSSDTKLEKIKLTRDYLDVNGDREYKGKSKVSSNIDDKVSSNESGVVPDE